MALNALLFFSSQFHALALDSNGELQNSNRIAPDTDLPCLIADGYINLNGAHRFWKEIQDLDSGLDCALIRHGSNETFHVDDHKEQIKAYPASDVYNCLLQAYKPYIGLSDRKQIHHGFAMTKGVLETLLATSFNCNHYVVVWWS